MRIQYEITIDDIVASDEFHYSHSPYFQRRRIWHRRGVALYLLFAPIFIVPLFAPNVSLLPVFFLSLAASALFYTTYHARRKQRRTRLIHKMLAEGRKEAEVGEAELELTDIGLRLRSDYAETTLAWKGLERIETTADYTFIYTSAVHSLIIPHDRIIAGDLPAMLAEINRRYRPARQIEVVGIASDDHS